MATHASSSLARPRLILLVLVSAAGCRTAAPDAIEAKVKRLGIDETESLGTLKALHAQPRRAVPLLVEELHVIEPGPPYEQKSWKETSHVIWNIRALRSITGQRFEFTTSEPLTSQQKEFLRADKPLPFFALWMSRSRFYVAPEDVQRKAIAAWRHWARSNLDTLEPKNYEAYGEWFW